MPVYVYATPGAVSHTVGVGEVALLIDVHGPGGGGGAGDPSSKQYGGSGGGAGGACRH